jgi:nucleotide-binding universal stress UspA family protein
MFKKILCPIDLDVFSEPQLNFARSLARSQQAELVALHVIPMPIGLYDMVSLIELQKVADEYAKERAVQLCGNDVRLRFARGIVEHQIMEAAEQENCDLIVMPTHGYRGFKRFFFGSVFQAVVARSHKPVMALPPGYLEQGKVEFVKPNSILCAVDLEKGSEILIKFADQLAEEFQGKFTILHSVDFHKELLEMVVPPKLMELQEDTKAKILKTSASSPQAERILVEKGPANDQILKQSLETNARLVILGMHRKSRLRLRTTLYRTVAELGIPALCIPVE